ncbi:MAG: YgiT-type zinc finger protein [Blastocatellia bacterium]
MNERSYDYGKCEICGEKMVEQQIKQDFWIKGNLIVIEDVPAGVCPQCGEKVVKADIGQQLGLMLADHNQIQPIRSINVPVIQFKQAA